MTTRRRNYTLENENGQQIGGTHSIPEADARKHLVNQECWCQPAFSDKRDCWHHFEARCVKRAPWKGWGNGRD